MEYRRESQNADGEWTGRTNWTADVVVVRAVFNVVKGLWPARIVRRNISPVTVIEVSQSRPLVYRLFVR